MTQISIVPLQAQHVDACARLMVALPLWGESYGVTYDAARVRFESGPADSADVYVALVEDEMVGFGWFVRRGAFARSGYIRLLGVRADWQGRGVGTQLMDFTEETLFAEDKDIFLLTFAPNEGAQRFYRQRGYEQVGVLTDYSGPGIDECIFRKRRPASPGQGVIVVGLMSGTSVDGIDAAVCQIEGAPPHLQVELLSFTRTDFDPTLRSRIFRAFSPQTGTVDLICALNFEIGEAFARAALRAVERAGLAPEEVHLIGSHGQTIYHLPGGPVPSTLQIGEAAVIAERTGVTTVADFRVADVAAGGQGAPLVSYVDYLLFRHEGKTRAVQNIGGIANVTLLPARCSPEEVLAFDTGPGNMLIDHAAQRATDGEWNCDHNGQLAARGKVDEKLLAELMSHPYLKRPPPKTTGREVFGAQLGDQIWQQAKAQGLADEDIVATLTAFTARSIADAYHRFLPPMEEVILGGGGSHNSILRGMIEGELAPARVLLHEDFGLSADAKEALAFAVLAYEAWHGRPGNLPSATGASHRVVLGKISPGQR